MSVYWDYSFLHGPERWHLNWKIGGNQSPVNISPNETKFNDDFHKNPLKIERDSIACRIQNSGLHLVFTPLPLSKRLSVTGGPLRDKYVFEQFHFHWGMDDSCGSEHTVSGRSYAAEVHLVHWNGSKYDTFQEAAKQSDGLTVFGVFLDVEGNERAHAMLEKLTRVIRRVQYKGDTYDMKDTFNPYDILPNNISDYWTYQGSLTTPPCYESVTWIVFREPIRISRQEIGKLRSLKSIAHFEVDTTNKYHDQMSLLRNCGKNPQCIGNNFRPVFPLGDRIVQSSFI